MHIFYSSPNIAFPSPSIPTSFSLHSSSSFIPPSLLSSLPCLSINPLILTSSDTTTFNSWPFFPLYLLFSFLSLIFSHFILASVYPFFFSGTFNSRSFFIPLLITTYIFPFQFLLYLPPFILLFISISRLLNPSSFLSLHLSFSPFFLHPLLTVFLSAFVAFFLSFLPCLSHLLFPNTDAVTSLHYISSIYSFLPVSLSFLHFPNTNTPTLFRCIFPSIYLFLIPSLPCFLHLPIPTLPPSLRFPSFTLYLPLFLSPFHVFANSSPFTSSLSLPSPSFCFSPLFFSLPSLYLPLSLRFSPSHHPSRSHWQVSRRQKFISVSTHTDAAFFPARVGGCRLCLARSRHRGFCFYFFAFVAFSVFASPPGRASEAAD